MSMTMHGTLVIIYISSLQLFSPDYDAFEASYGIFYEAPEWRHRNRAGDCWGREWPACRCRPVAAVIPWTGWLLLRRGSQTSLLARVRRQAIRQVLRDVPKDHHLIMKMQDARVVRYLNARLRERREEGFTLDRQSFGQHHDCDGFVKAILPEIEERIAAGALVHIDRVDCEV